MLTLTSLALSLANHTQHAPPEHALRLVGYSKNEGVLQIYHKGAWGNICDDNWDMRDALVACRQLGLGTAREALLTNYDGNHYTYDWSADNDYTIDYVRQQRGEPIWMDNVRCSGTEARLADCAFHGWGVNDCGHYEDAAIRCDGLALQRTIAFSITFFCVSTFISLVAVAIAFVSLMRVWRITRGPLMNPHMNLDIAQVALSMPHAADEPVVPGRKIDGADGLL